MVAKVTRSAPLQAALLRSVIRGFGRLSLPAARRVGKGIGSLLWRLPNQFRENSWRNVRRCFPDLDDNRRSRIVRKSLVATGLTLAEAGAMFHWPIARLRALEASSSDLELLEPAVAAGRGVIILAPHVGNWEFLSHAITFRYPIVNLYRPPRIAELDEYLRRCRQRLGSELVPVSAGGLRRIARQLSSGGVVGILPDQEPLKSHGVFAPFFGIPALTMTLVGNLARRYGSALYFGVAERTDLGAFRIHLRPGSPELGNPDPLLAATALNEGVEALVRQFPEQYVWSYRRFRTRPPEELAARQAKAAAVKRTTAAS